MMTNEQILKLVDAYFEKEAAWISCQGSANEHDDLVRDMNIITQKITKIAGLTKLKQLLEFAISPNTQG